MKWNDMGEKVLNTLTVIYLTLSTKAFFGIDSFKTSPVWKNELHVLLRCDFDPFFYKSTTGL